MSLFTVAPRLGQECAAQRERRPIGAIDQSVLEQPLPRAASVPRPPRAGRAFAKAVTPAVHVGEAALAAEAAELVGEQQLEVADAALLVVVAARVGGQSRPALGVHADIVAELVQHGVRRCVGAHVESIADEPGFGLAPVRARDRLAVRELDDAHAVLRR
jgi:hypothetical protein